MLGFLIFNAKGAVVLSLLSFYYLLAFFYTSCMLHGSVICCCLHKLICCVCRGSFEHCCKQQPCSAIAAGADAFLMEALFRNEVWGFMQLPVSRENEAAACHSMIEGCRSDLI